MQKKKASAGAKGKAKSAAPQGKKESAKKAEAAKSKRTSAGEPEKERKSRPVLSFCITAFITLILIFLLIFDDMAFAGSVLRPLICGLVGEWGLMLLPAYLIVILVSWFKDRITKGRPSL